MTTFKEVPFVCAICQTSSDHYVVMSTNLMGSPDLDLRPPKMQRSVLAYGVQTCGTCGFCAPRIDEAPAVAAKVITTEEYHQQLRETTLPPKVNAFLCAALIQEKHGDVRRAAASGLSAAWLCDDAGNIEGSRSCRVRAASLLERSLVEGPRVDTEPGID